MSDVRTDVRTRVEVAHVTVIADTYRVTDGQDECLLRQSLE